MKLISHSFKFTRRENCCSIVTAVNQFNPASPSLVVSTHLDDAVLSCGQLLSVSPETTVLTVLAGAPNELRKGYNAVTTGELYAPDAVRTRRNEDTAAMEYLSVRSPEWLELFDSDFINWRRLDRTRRRKDRDELRVAVRDSIRKINPKSVITPLGLVHQDHLAVADACIELSKEFDVEWFLYLDMPYAQRLSKGFKKREIAVTRILKLEELDHLPIVGDKKHNAFKIYASQYSPLGGGGPQLDQELMTPEMYWRVLK